MRSVADQYVLLDIFGPVPWESAQHGYRYVLGIWCECTGFRWVFGCKTHTESDVEHHVQCWRASMKLLRPDLDVDIVRTDGAAENRSHKWRSFLASSGILHEESIAYSAHQMGGIEHGWLHVPNAGAMLAVARMGKRHWYSALRYAITLSNLAASTVSNSTSAVTSAFERLFLVKPRGDHLHVYGAPVRYHSRLHTMGRDDKFDEHAHAGFYVGPSPENPDECWIWTGSRHISCGASIVIDETVFTQPLHLDSEYFTSWPTPTPASDLPPGSRAPQPLPPTVQVPSTRKDALQNGTALEFRYLNAIGTVWEWYRGSVVGSRARRDGGVEHEIHWDSPQWPANEWVNLASSVRVWRHLPPAPPATAPAPAASAPSPAPPAPPPRRSARFAASANATAAPRVLVVFAGKDRPLNLPAALRRRGAVVDAIDVELGGPSHDILLPSVRARLRQLIISNAYSFVYLAPPCKSFSCAHDAPLRPRDNPDSFRDGLSPDQLRAAERANSITMITASLATTAFAHGIPYAIENPADRGDTDSDAFWQDKADHCPMWLLAPMRILRDATQPRIVTFPQCALGAPWQKYSTLWTTSDAVAGLFDNLVCDHREHAAVAYGVNADGAFISADSAAYPPAMDDALARGIVAAAVRIEPFPRVTASTKIDGLHPVAAPRPLYDVASLRLAQSANVSESSSAWLLNEASVFANSPLCEYWQSDIVSTSPSTSPAVPVPDVIQHFRDGDDVYVLEIRDDDGDLHPALLLSRARASKPDRKTVVYYTPDGVVRAIEPKGVKEALASLQRDLWIAAMDKELDNLKSHDAFHYVSRASVLAKGKRILRMTWVFKIKTDAEGWLNKYKARYCVVGTGQVQGEDYWEKFSSGARSSSIKIVIALVTVADWIDFHFDLDGAYLDAAIDAEVYVDQPSGMDPEVGPRGEPLVMALDKAIYGTVQAGRLFTKKFRAALCDIGFESSLDDESVFRLDHRLGRAVLTTHVDDGIGGASTQAILDWVHDQIEKHGFKFSARGPWHTLVGFGVRRDRVARTTSLNAAKQIEALAREHLAGERSVNPPTPSCETIMKLQPAPPETPEEASANLDWRSQARSLKGALLHIQLVHPGIAHANSRVCVHMATPTRASHAAAKRILAWLSHRTTLGITFGDRSLKSLEDLQSPAEPVEPMSATRDFSLHCTVDSDMPGHPLEATDNAAPANSHINVASHRAQLAYNIMLAGAPVDSNSRRQPSISLDTAAAELYAASAAAAVLVTIISTVAFLSFGVLGRDTVRVWCDNNAAVLAANDASSVKRLAYVARRLRWLQELGLRKYIRLLNVSGKANPADALTKHLNKYEFREYMTRLYNCAPGALVAASHGSLSMMAATPLERIVPNWRFHPDLLGVLQRYLQTLMTEYARGITITDAVKADYASLHRQIQQAVYSAHWVDQCIRLSDELRRNRARLDRLAFDEANVRLQIRGLRALISSLSDLQSRHAHVVDAVQDRIVAVTRTSTELARPPSPAPSPPADDATVYDPYNAYCPDGVPGCMCGYQPSAAELVWAHLLALVVATSQRIDRLSRPLLAITGSFWHVSHSAWNRLQHALHGNTTRSLSLQRLYSMLARAVTSYHNNAGVSPALHESGPRITRLSRKIARLVLLRDGRCLPSYRFWRSDTRRDYVMRCITAVAVHHHERRHPTRSRETAAAFRIREMSFLIMDDYLSEDIGMEFKHCVHARNIPIHWRDVYDWGPPPPPPASPVTVLGLLA